MKRLTHVFLLSALVAVTGAAGCSNPTSAPQNTGAPTAAVADGDASGWRARIAREAEALRREHPDAYQQLETATGRVTRPGFLRIPLPPAAERHDAGAVLLQRYLGESDPATRAALIDALPRAGGEFSDAIVELLPTEREASVRKVMVGVLARQAGADAERGILAGLSDSDASVRLGAAVAAGRRAQAGKLVPALQARLTDESAAVRAQAARALGVHDATSATPALVTALADDDADVRLQALHALSRIDGGAAAAQAQLAYLTRDDDPRVRRAAESFTRADR